MHECEICGMYCDCDGEDLDQPAPLDCDCDHEGSGLDEDGDPFDEYIADDCSSEEFREKVAMKAERKGKL